MDIHTPSPLDLRNDKAIQGARASVSSLSRIHRRPALALTVVAAFLVVGAVGHRK